jgi:hypothetical protein
MNHDILPADIESGLLVVLRALRPYLPQLVLIGGWVPYLYKRYGGIGDWTGHLSLTVEADVLIPRELPAESRPSIADALRAAGFRPEEGRFDVVWAGDPLRGERVEFLVPHSGTQRDISRATSIRGQAGVAAWALDRLTILQKNTSTMVVPTGMPEPDAQLFVRVPRLTAYLIQKAATFVNRLVVPDSGRQKAAKDLLYIRDVLGAGDPVVAHVRAEIVELARDRDVLELAGKGAQNLEGVVRGAMRSLIADAAAMRQEREPATSRLAATAEMEGRLRDAIQLFQSTTARQQVPRRGG